MNPEQRARYQSMTSGGAIAMLKRDILLEAVRDVRFVYEVHAWFSQNCGDSSFATPFSVKVVAELIGQGLVNLATWSETAKGELLPLQVTDEELVAMVNEVEKPGPGYLLAPTPRAREWVARYYKLLNELQIE